MRRICLIATSLALLSALSAASARAAVSLEPVGSFDQPIYVTSGPVDSDRLFVAERDGVVRVVKGGSVSTFANFSALVSVDEGERGLLSIALAPDFAGSGRLYAAYTGTPAAGSAEGDVHVDAFRHDGAGELVRERILTVGHHDYGNHNGGQLQFGPDGYLYVSLGDGGGGGDPLGSGQNLDSLLGKLLRIEPRPGQIPTYRIPSDNPFVERAGRDEIWAYGFRNPWRFSFDREGGDLVIGDVGQDTREEIDFVPSPAAGTVGGAGGNFGWNCREGLIAYPEAPEACEGAGPFVNPVFDYPHVNPGGGAAHGCAITGGYVVRDPSLGELYEHYVYGDYCVGQIRSIDLSAQDPAATDGAETGLSVPAFSLYSFGEDSCGRIYVVDGGGEISRLVGEEAADCPPGEEPEPEPEPEPEGGGGPPPGTPQRQMDTNVPGAAPRVRLRATPGRVLRGRWVHIVVRVEPCASFRRGELVLLNRGGERVASKRLGHGCIARFRLQVNQRMSFRALLPLPPGDGEARSPRLVIHIRGSGA